MNWQWQWKVSWFVKSPQRVCDWNSEKVSILLVSHYYKDVLQLLLNFPVLPKFSFDFQMHLRVCLLLALGCIASSQRFQQQRGARRPGGPPGRGGPGGPRGPLRRAQVGAAGVQRRGPGGPGPAPGVPDGFARRQSASIRPGQGERRYQVFTDPAQVWLDLYFVFVSSISI